MREFLEPEYLGDGNHDESGVKRMADAGSDGKVLAKAAQGDERAFEELVQRHGPLVLGACLRILRQREEAEDAAQAVFIALGHKAGDRSLQARSSLAGWLYQTAWFVSLRSKEARVLQKRHEQEAARQSAKDAAPESDWNEIAPLLDRALNELPEKFRLPIVLHHLKGLPATAVGSAMNCSEQAIKHRLVRGREMLRERLARWGVKTSASALSVVISANALGAPLPEAFASATAKAAGLAAGGKLAAAGLSTKVSSLAEGGLKMMLMAKVKAAAVVLVVASVAGGALGVTAYRVFAGETTEAAVPIADATKVQARDWPGWHGPTRNGISGESEWTSDWPKEGPKKLWEKDLGYGYGGLLVTGKYLLAVANPGWNQVEKNKHVALLYGLNKDTGEELWKARVGEENCPGSTPATDGKAVYYISGSGLLQALDLETGKQVWETHLAKEGLIKVPNYGVAASPLLYKDFIIVQSGVALDKKNGKVAWETPLKNAGMWYSSPVLTRFEGKDAVVFIPRGSIKSDEFPNGPPVTAVDAQTGKELWKGPPMEGVYTDPVPLENGDIVVTQWASRVLKVQNNSATLGETFNLPALYQTPIIWKGHGYAYMPDATEDPQVIEKKGILECWDMTTRTRNWRKEECGGMFTLAGGRLVIMTHTGVLIIADADPKEYRELARFRLHEFKVDPGLGPRVEAAMSAPFVCGGRLYCRRSKTITCLDVRKK